MSFYELARTVDPPTEHTSLARAAHVLLGLPLDDRPRTPRDHALLAAQIAGLLGATRLKWFAIGALGGGAVVAYLAWRLYQRERDREREQPRRSSILDGRSR